MPVAPTEPPAVKTITVRVESDPPGASVVNAASGGVLGVTPLVLTRPRGGALKLRLEKDGFTPNAHDVTLDDDQTVELTLEHKPKPRPHRPRPPAGRRAGEALTIVIISVCRTSRATGTPLRMWLSTISGTSSTVTPTYQTASG